MYSFRYLIILGIQYFQRKGKAIDALDTSYRQCI